MSVPPVIAIFDLGKTHKKFLVFDQRYQLVDELATTIPDTIDEDGHPCEDLQAISIWMKESIGTCLQRGDYAVKAINFSAHGASWVHLDDHGIPATPLYDYMKPLLPEFTEDFYGHFGGRESFSMATGSPALDMLNSGLQLYWIKKQKPKLFQHIRTSLHFPQYGNYLFSKKRHADITSIGCHTGLWDFEQRTYHAWLRDEGLRSLLPDPAPPEAFDEVDYGPKGVIPTGIGLHDSSAALLPFIYTAKKPFMLLSSGTWNITLNPYFSGNLSAANYRQDCLYYLRGLNKRVAASRIFLGHEYQYQVSRLEAYYQKGSGYASTIKPQAHLFETVLQHQSPDRVFYPQTMANTGPFPGLNGIAADLNKFTSFEEAYHKLMLDLTYLQQISIGLLHNIRIPNHLYVSGGFVQNEVFMEVLSAFLPGWKIFIAENKRASALGAAVALHSVWQESPLDQSWGTLYPFIPKEKIFVDQYHSYFEVQSSGS